MKFGGLKKGLLSVWYQVGIEATVKIEPIEAARNGGIKDTASLITVPILPHSTKGYSVSTGKVCCSPKTGSSSWSTVATATTASEPEAKRIKITP